MPHERADFDRSAEGSLSPAPDYALEEGTLFTEAALSPDADLTDDSYAGPSERDEMQDHAHQLRISEAAARLAAALFDTSPSEAEIRRLLDARESAGENTAANVNPLNDTSGDPLIIIGPYDASRIEIPYPTKRVTGRKENPDDKPGN